MHARFEAERGQLLREVNARLPAGVAVMAWDLLPPGAWTGYRGQFLMEIGRLFPAEPANTMLLPAGEAGCSLLGLPLPPQARSRRIEDDAAKVVDVAMQLFDRAPDRSKAHAAARQQARALPRIMMQKTFEQRIWRRHERLFASLLGRGDPG